MRAEGEKTERRREEMRPTHAQRGQIRKEFEIKGGDYSESWTLLHDLRTSRDRSRSSSGIARMCLDLNYATKIYVERELKANVVN